MIETDQNPYIPMLASLLSNAQLFEIGGDARNIWLGDVLPKLGVDLARRAVDAWVGNGAHRMPTFTELKHVARGLNKGAKKTSAQVMAWWGVDGQWGGDWSHVAKPKLALTFAVMAVHYWPGGQKTNGNTDSVLAFRAMCLDRGISSERLKSAESIYRDGGDIDGWCKQHVAP